MPQLDDKMLQLLDLLYQGEQSGKQPSFQELATALGITKGSVSNWVRILVGGKYITRTTGRCAAVGINVGFRLLLTPGGREVAEARSHAKVCT